MADGGRSETRGDERRAGSSSPNAEANHWLFRLALKMATGSKTTVMAMLIAAGGERGPGTRRIFSRLLIVPGHHHRDRLRVRCHETDNYYETREIVPPKCCRKSAAPDRDHNYHSFQHREHCRCPRSRSFLRAMREPIRRRKQTRRYWRGLRQLRTTTASM